MGEGRLGSLLCVLSLTFLVIVIIIYIDLVGGDGIFDVRKGEGWKRRGKKNKRKEKKIINGK